MGSSHADSSAPAIAHPTRNVPPAGNSKQFTDATQICYLIAYVLIAIIKKELQRDASLHTCRQILSVFIFEKTQISCDLHQIISNPTRTATLTS
jgi:hypothetical protein